MAYNLQKFQIDSSQAEISTNFFIPQKFICILDQLGLNFDVINLKFVQIVGNIIVYNLWKFHIDNLQIEFFYSAKILPHFGSARPRGDSNLNLKQIPTTPWCPMYWRVTTHWGPMHRRVKTPRGPMLQNLTRWKSKMVLCTGESWLHGVLCTRKSRLPGVICTRESFSVS